MVQLKRKEKESFEGLMRRFNRTLQQGGILVVAREEMFRKRKESKTKKREAAIRKQKRKIERIKKFLY